MKAFDRELCALNDGWRLRSIEVKLQTDGCLCDLWDLVVDRGFVDMASFDAFLCTWLSQLQPQPVVDLHLQ